MKRYLILGFVLALAVGVAAQQRAFLGGAIGTQTVITGATIAGGAMRLDTLYASRNADGDTLPPNASTAARAPYLAISVSCTSEVGTAATYSDSGWTVTIKTLRFGTYASTGIVSAAVVADIPTPNLSDSTMVRPALPTTAGGERTLTVIVRNTANAYQVITRNKAVTGTLTGYAVRWEPWYEE